jgi:hypothetical protein
MTPVHSPHIIDVALFIQNGGWIFIGVEHGEGFYGHSLFSGKRRSLDDAIDIVKKLAPDDSRLLYCVMNNTMNEWETL